MVQYFATWAEDGPARRHRLRVDKENRLPKKEAQTTSSDASRDGLAALIKALRVSHWTKNFFVFAALLFGAHWERLDAWGLSLAAFVAFCLTSSAVYLINDVCDRQTDRAHPAKRFRPVASGRLPVAVAMAAAGVLLALAAVVVAFVGLRSYGLSHPLHGLGLPIWTAAYLALNLAYSLGLKARPILDVVIVALGFVLRAMAGAAAINVPASPWLVVCTFMLCLFIALAKRRSEILELGEQAAATRRVNRFYTVGNLEHMLAVAAGLAILAYSLYCLAPQTVSHVHSANLIWTIPLVVYGMFRYYCLTLTAGTQDPTRLLLCDKVLWLVGMLWLAMVVAVLKWGAGEFFRGIIDSTGS
jgi:4-hydroxybenzoate polyprenyltransferase